MNSPTAPTLLLPPIGLTSSSSFQVFSRIEIVPSNPRHTCLFPKIKGAQNSPQRGALSSHLLETFRYQESASTFIFNDSCNTTAARYTPPRQNQVSCFNPPCEIGHGRCFSTVRTPDVAQERFLSLGRNRVPHRFCFGGQCMIHTFSFSHWTTAFFAVCIRRFA